MTQDDWGEFHKRRARLRPPLRPDEEIVGAFSRAISGHTKNVLLLGITPELCDLAEQVTAVDKSQEMIAHVWPGDTPRRRAVLGDWRALPAFERAFTSAIGDGSLNTLLLRDYEAVFACLERLLLPGARLAVRTYLTPEPCEAVKDLTASVMAGRAAGFHGFKWRLAMAIVAQSGTTDIPVAKIHQIFQREFPDRARLSHATGWSEDQIAEIDAYRESDLVYSFPTRRSLAAAIPATFSNVRFQSSGDYDLAERCPILVADFRP